MGEWVCLVDEKVIAGERARVKGICFYVCLEAMRSLVILLSGISLHEGSAFYAFKIFFFWFPVTV